MCAFMAVCLFHFRFNNLVRLIRTRMSSEAHTMSPATFRSNIMIYLEASVAHQRYRRHQTLERMIERSHIYLLLSIIGRFRIIIIIICFSRKMPFRCFAIFPRFALLHRRLSHFPIFIYGNIATVRCGKWN